MCKLNGSLKCYDTLKGEYVTVPVSEEIETFVKRSYWKEDMQGRRFTQRIQELEATSVKQEDIYYDRDRLVDYVIGKHEAERVRSCIKGLSERNRRIVYMVYYEELTLTEVARRLRLSTSYISRLVKKVHEEIYLKLAQDGQGF